MSAAAQRTDTLVQPMNAHAGALWAVRRGLRVLRVAPNGKLPYRKGINEATTDEATVNRWFAEEPTLNYGIAMGGPERLVALDCDAKHDSYHVDYLNLCHSLTLEFVSGTGGSHVIFRTEFDAGQIDLAGATSINVRAEGGYVVGPGSIVNGNRYRVYQDAPVAMCPAEIAARLSRRGEKAADNSTPAAELDTLGALTWADEYVRHAPAAELGNRNGALFRLACVLKDKGVSCEYALAALLEHWCPRCDPPYEDEGEIEKSVASAYNNGQRQPGVEAPELEFEDVGEAITEALTNLRHVKPAQSPTIRATPYVWTDPAGIPPRDWLYGRHLVRKFMSATVAPGGIGKSSLVFVEGISIATGRALLLDRAPKPGRVWLWNGEDPYDELQRRIQAVCLHYGIGREDIEGRLFVDSGRATPIVIATETRNGAKIAEPVVEQVKRTIRENAIDVFTVDPFVSCHSVSENDNSKIEAVAWEWAKIADECGCAVELVHHTRKTGGAEVTAEDARGASALHGKARSVRTLNRMTADEGKRAGVDHHRLYFRVDDGKANMAPPSDAAAWYRLESVALGNATGDRLTDQVGVVIPWTWPDAFDGLPDDALLRAQQALAEGQWRADARSPDWAGYAVAQALGIDTTDNERGREQVKELLRLWLGQGSLVKVDGRDQNRNVRQYIRPACISPATDAKD